MSTWQIGDVRVTRVVELEGPVPGEFFFEGYDAAAVLAHEWLRPHFVLDDGRLLGTIQALLVESDGRRIVVDTCVGNDKVRANPLWNRMQTGFLSQLEDAGFPADSIDTVI